MLNTSHPSVRAIARTVRSAGLATLAAAGMLAASACNLEKTLAVPDVDVATLPNLNNKAGLPVLYGGALSDFQNQLTSTDGTVTFPGLLTDELRDIDTFPTRIEVDQRHITMAGNFGNNGTLNTWYRAMQRARVSLERAANAYERFDATNQNLAEMHALDGMMYAYFAEDFCNGVAYSNFNGGQNPTYGGPNTPQQSLALAVAQFDSALKLAADSSNNRYLAEVGKARALVDLGLLDSAAKTVADVPVTFQYYVNNSTNSSTEQSGIYINVGPPSKRYAVANNDGGNGLFFRSEGRDSSKTANPTQTGDVRVRWYQLFNSNGSPGTGQDGVSPAYFTLKYPDYSTGVVVADGIEAQLIIAEDQLHNSNPAWLTTLNALRANTALLNRPPYTLPGQSSATPLPPLTDAGSTDANVDQLFHERAFWMYLTGHRLGDMRRLVTQYNRPVESVFPTGTYTGAAGGSFGTDTNFPIPIDEQNNPNSHGCVDRNP